MEGKGFSRPYFYKLFLAIVFCFSTISAATDYTMEFANETQVNDSSYYFDVMIKGNSQGFNLSSYQCALFFNAGIQGNTHIQFSFITGSSEILNVPTNSVECNHNDGNEKLTFASGAGNDFIASNKFTKIGTFKISFPSGYKYSAKELSWSFDGSVQTIITGDNFEDISEPYNHLTSNYLPHEIQKQLVQSVSASETTELNHTADKTIDGLTTFDNDVDSRWAANPAPANLIYDLGSLKEITQTRISFYRWDFDRIYNYNIKSSSDGSTWNTLIADRQSDTTEWSIDNFSPAKARFIKFEILSNNQSDWASVWEVEFYGIDNILSVELSTFNAAVADNSVQLNWETNSEQNNKGFEIQRKSDSDFDWLAIGFVNGNGKESTHNQYSYVDRNLSGGQNFQYRLKQIDFNGEYTFTEIVDVNYIPNSFELFQNYPNPFNPSTKIKFSINHDAPVKLTVYNMLGQEVKELLNETKIAGTHIIEFDAVDMTSGAYIYRLDVKDQYSAVKKMMLVK